MKLVLCNDKHDLGRRAAQQTAALLNEAIAKNGRARILLSTGASQFTFFEALKDVSVDWSRVEMFHLDEYVGISPDHPASFQRYLLDRFVNVVHPKAAYLLNGEQDPEKTIADLTARLAEYPIDVGLIGIGENAHIAFNDPPANFDDTAAYRVVTLAQRCLQQQIGEGWFKNVEETYKQAISMTCQQIMKCKTVICAVPYAVKADAIYQTLANDLTPDVPATLLKNHADCTVYCDPDSAANLTPELIAKYQ